MTGEFEQVLPGLWRFVSGRAGAQHPVNSYLCRSGHGAVLIDPAADVTPAAVARTGTGDVSDILVTHFQEENVAGCRHFPAARLHVPAGQEYLADGAVAYAGIVQPWPPPWDWDSRGNFHGHMSGARNERPLSDPAELSESIHAGASPAGWHVLSTPGHGKHAVTLLADVAGKRVALCGDLICGEGKLWNWFDCEWDYNHQTGRHALLQSAQRLAAAKPDLLCPTHGPVIAKPARALELLVRRLTAVLTAPWPQPGEAMFRPDRDSRAPGFRALLPYVHQVREGNCAVLVSDSGAGLMIDDGLCNWTAEPERSALHRRTIEDLKQSLGIRRIEMVIPTHYHGDHIENIPDLVATDRCQVVSLDLVADPIEHPERFNLACLLPWYGAKVDRVKVDRRVGDGARLSWHEFELEIFHLGGQTYYHAGILATGHGARIVFAGDSASGLEPSWDAVICYCDAEPASRGWAYALDRLCERPMDLLVCGHAVAAYNPMPFLRKMRTAWGRRIRQFADLSARGTAREFFDPFLP